MHAGTWGASAAFDVKAVIDSFFDIDRVPQSRLQAAEAQVSQRSGGTAVVVTPPSPTSISWASLLAPPAQLCGAQWSQVLAAPLPAVEAPGQAAPPPPGLPLAPAPPPPPSPQASPSPTPPSASPSPTHGAAPLCGMMSALALSDNAPEDLPRVSARTRAEQAGMVSGQLLQSAIDCVDCAWSDECLAFVCTCVTVMRSSHHAQQKACAWPDQCLVIDKSNVCTCGAVMHSGMPCPCHCATTWFPLC